MLEGQGSEGSNPFSTTNFMWKIFTMFQADSGKVGAVRVAFLVSLFAVLANWTIINYQKGELQSIPESVIVLVLGLGGFKAYQGFTDKPLTTPPKSDTLKP